jgi:hypothetical protein
MNIGTTSLDSLPISPQTGDNIRLETREKNVRVNNPGQNLQQERDNDLLAMQQNAVQGQQMQGQQMQGQQMQGQQMQMQGQQMQGQQLQMQQGNLNQFVTGIQQASAAGLTALPSRDIPQNQQHISQDFQIQPNYIPQPPPGGSDYIREQQTTDEIIRAQAHKQSNQDSLDGLYNELQTPLLIGVLYFLFQLPIVQKQILKLLPSLFNKDGNPNLSGYIVTSAAFAGAYFVLVKGMRLLESR